MRRFIRENGLSLVMFGLFLLAFLGQIVSGYLSDAEEREDGHLPRVSVGRYLTSGHFIEATFENWESEFLQMAAYVTLTSVLIQRGSPESHDPDGDDLEEKEPLTQDSPGPARSKGLIRWLYERSLSIALLLLFAFSFFLHAVGGAREETKKRAEHGKPPVSTIEFIREPDFWFQSFQNWQSEFLSIGAFVVLGIYLRQKGSPESKPVNAPYGKTGS